MATICTNMSNAYDAAVGEDVAWGMVDAIEEQHDDDDLGSWDDSRWAEVARECLYDPEYHIPNRFLGLSGNDMKALFAWATEGRDGWEILEQDPIDIIGTALARLWAYG